MKYRHAAGMFFVAFVIQTTLMNVVSIFGVTPNLLLCLVVILSFLYDENYYGIVFGVIFGLLYDICFAEYVGITSLAFLVISLAIMMVNIVMNKESVLSILTVSVAATVLYILIYWGITAIMGSGYSFIYVARILPLYVAYNVIIVIILYLLMIKKVIRHHYDRYYR